MGTVEDRESPIPSNALTRVGAGSLATYGAPLTAAAVKAQVQLIQEVMRDVMKKDEHYGVIPGCGDKPTLLQPGAEKLALTFRLAPTYEITKEDLGGGHREYVVKCIITSSESGAVVGSGVGSCSTMESKYRYRNVADFEITGDPIPKDAKDKKKEYRRAGFGMKKVDNVWEWVRYTDAAKSENPDIADTWNTVLKMAKKRALVDGMKSTTAASDIFTQDIEDFPRHDEGDDAPPAPPMQPLKKTPPPTARQSRPAASAATKARTEPGDTIDAEEVGTPEPPTAPEDIFPDDDPPAEATPAPKTPPPASKPDPDIAEGFVRKIGAAKSVEALDVIAREMRTVYGAKSPKDVVAAYKARYAALDA